MTKGECSTNYNNDYHPFDFYKNSTDMIHRIQLPKLVFACATWGATTLQCSTSKNQRSILGKTRTCAESYAGLVRSCLGFLPLPLLLLRCFGLCFLNFLRTLERQIVRNLLQLNKLHTVSAPKFPFKKGILWFCSSCLDRNISKMMSLKSTIHVQWLVQPKGLLCCKVTKRAFRSFSFCRCRALSCSTCCWDGVFVRKRWYITPQALKVEIHETKEANQSS